VRRGLLAVAVSLLVLAGSAGAAGRADDRILIETRSNLLTIEPTGKGLTVVFRRGWMDPAWSPDRRSIAAVAGGLMVVDPDGTSRELVARGVILNPSWSPDGKRIAFSMIDNARCNRLRLDKCRQEIYVVSVDGSGLRRLTDGRDADNGHFAPAWSPDGRSIAYSAFEAFGDGRPARRRKQSRVMVVSAAGGKPRLLLRLPYNYHADDLGWSRAGGIVFSYMRGSGVYRGNPVVQSKLAVVKPDGSGLRDLTKFSAGLADDPAWSPDGRRVAFIGRLRGDLAPSWFAYVLTPGRKPEKLTGARSLDW